MVSGKESGCNFYPLVKTHAGATHTNNTVVMTSASTDVVIAPI